MGVKTVDKDWGHLYPDFRERLKRVLSATSQKTGVEWKMAEGHRGAERQLWLWQSGRTRPGPILTWMKTPKSHGASLAADSYPPRINSPMHFYETYRECYLAEGLDNPAWTKSDLGHCQLSDPFIRQKALAWVRAGFQDPAPAHSDVKVYIGAELIPDADAYIAGGHVYAALRPLTDALDLVITKVVDGRATLVNDMTDFSIPLVMQGKRGFSPIWLLPAEVTWDPKTRTACIVKNR